MTDYANNLSEELQRKIKEYLKDDPKIKEFLNIIFSSQSYDDAYAYAHQYGGHLAQALTELGVDEWLFGTALDVWIPVLNDMQNDIGVVCEAIQTNKNAAANIGLKPQVVKYTNDDLREIVFQAIEDFQKSREIIEKFADKCVDTNQRANVDFTFKTGGKVFVKRTYDGIGLRRGTKSAESCQWCLERAGTYEFDNTAQCAASGVFERHDGCGCTIDYVRK